MDAVPIPLSENDSDGVHSLRRTDYKQMEYMFARAGTVGGVTDESASAADICAACLRRSWFQ